MSAHEVAELGQSARAAAYKAAVVASARRQAEAADRANGQMSERASELPTA